MQPPETVLVETTKVACNGGGGPLGHPLVYLNLGKDGTVNCPYCGRHFKLKEGAAEAAGH